MIAFVLAIGAGCIDYWVLRVCSVMCAALAVCLLFFPEIQIDPFRGRVVKVDRFLGILPVLQRERLITDFEGIHCHARGGAEDTTWLVALHPRTGRDVIVRQFSAPADHDCLEAREFARELSSLTGLKVIDPVF
jgi:hypothetical protein